MSGSQNGTSNGKMDTDCPALRNTTVIQSRAVQYLLMKVRDKNLHGKVTAKCQQRDT